MMNHSSDDPTDDEQMRYNVGLDRKEWDEIDDDDNGLTEKFENCMFDHVMFSDRSYCIFDVLFVVKDDFRLIVFS